MFAGLGVSVGLAVGVSAGMLVGMGASGSATAGAVAVAVPICWGAWQPASDSRATIRPIIRQRNRLRFISSPPAQIRVEHLFQRQTQQHQPERGDAVMKMAKPSGMIHHHMLNSRALPACDWASILPQLMATGSPNQRKRRPASVSIMPAAIITSLIVMREDTPGNTWRHITHHAVAPQARAAST